jgi:hypothetical protein
MNLSPETEKIVVKWATRGLASCVELRGQKQKSGKSADKQNPSVKKEFHYLELSLEFMATGEHFSADYFGPRDGVGPVPLLDAPRGSILIVQVGAAKSEFGRVSGRINEMEILHRAAFPLSGSEVGSVVQSPALSAAKKSA